MKTKQIFLVFAASAAAFLSAGIQAKTLRPIGSAPKYYQSSSSREGSSVLQPIASGTVNGVQTVLSQYGENHSVRMSSTLPNIIITPFAEASVVAVDGVDWTNNGSSLLISLRGSKNKAWISIVDKNNMSGTPISLTLVPDKKIGSQTVVVSLGKGASVKNEAVSGGGKNTYEQNIQYVFSSIARQQIPEGYSIRPLTSTFAMANGIRVDPIEMYSSADDDVLRYRLTNTTGQTQILVEEQFGRSDRVKGVSIYPKLRLRHGESTDVMIMIGKH